MAEHDRAPSDPLRHHGDAEVRGTGLLDLAVNVHPGPRPAWLETALRASLDDVGAYPDPGAAEHAIALRHDRPAEEVLATAGAAEAFSLVARLRPWRRPVVVHPQFTEPHAALERAGHRVTTVLTRAENGFALDPGAVPPDADLVVVGNPTNPTGRLHPVDDLLALRRPGRLVVVDEAFIDTVPGERGTLAGAPPEGLVVLRSLTKHWSIPGVRAGYLLGAAGDVAALRRGQVPWSVSTTAAAAIQACCTDEALAEAERRAHLITQWRTHLVAALAGLGIRTLPSQTSFLLARLGPDGRAHLREHGIAVRRCDTFPGLDPGWARIAVRPPGTTDHLVHALLARPIASPTPGGPMSSPRPLTAPDSASAGAAAERLAGLAVPAGALGRLGELGVWLSGVQGQCPPRPLDDVRLVIFAGDHGVAGHGVSAYPPAITAAMVRTFVAGRAGVNALAAAHDVRVRVLDVGVDDDLEGLPAEVSADKVRRGSGAIHLEDALSAEETQQALAVGRRVAEREIAEGAQLLLSGDMGIGNTTPAAALVAAGLGLGAADAALVAGRGTGVDDAGLDRKTAVLAEALARVGERATDPVETLTALGSADLAATVGYLLAATQAGVPVLLDGLMSVACALTAERIAPGTAAWCTAGHRSPEPAQSLALAHLGLEPLLDLGMRLGEGSGAVTAVPVLRSAVSLLRDVALLSELMPEAPTGPAGA
ncbi:Nicotinate-nucleotide--dimethylbenzimidazole phosphoribosyltransferase [Nocardioides dokdonensis FR1436]|uniref:Nicotinate-nucleotide--dimethylbenzimidazole phosphoribosyltransferase n=1 Tax=Nocardioides dokdonensis FR1436 TaxID=1300347 RepID=A0A1A9GPJ0_9ACTN|nr:Rv2231c family pyridoxal phosphate-dependent protein CobC [Nocardioides dokdonensis]ANH40247.1 Nicotinate-nucleotide--dimethylbenzimidazole phosphoribosyltransferase [Nocardioides dokdonensis FR1436]